MIRSHPAHDGPLLDATPEQYQANLPRAIIPRKSVAGNGGLDSPIFSLYVWGAQFMPRCWAFAFPLYRRQRSRTCRTDVMAPLSTHQDVVVGAAPQSDMTDLIRNEGRLVHSAVRGAAAVGVSQGIRIGTQLLSVVILARLLTPADFGMVASITPLTAFVVLFQDLGLQQAIVQRRDVSEEQLSAAFWLTVLLGLACAFIVVVCAPVVAVFFHDGRLALLTMATAPSLAAASLGSIPTALLNRRMAFRAIALLDAGMALTVFVTAIGSAWLGAQYWALIIGTLAGNLFYIVSVWRAAQWRPARPSLRLPDRHMLGFGANLTGFTFVSFLARNLDNVLIGHFSGSVALGYYDRAYKLLLFPLANVNAPITRIAVPLLSRMESDKPRLRRAYLRIISQVTLVTVPGMAALVATADETVNLLFGPGWQDVVPIFTWLGLAGLLQPVIYSVNWLMIAQARTATMFRWGLYASTTAISSFAVGLHWGAVGVACAFTISDYVLRLPVLCMTVQRVGPVTALDLVTLQGPLLAAAAATVVLTRSLLQQYVGLSGVYLIAAAVVVSYSAAAAMMALIPRNRTALRDTRSLLGQLRRKVRFG
jgi:O-antigen/teichoic acid export membrane protein